MKHKIVQFHIDSPRLNPGNQIEYVQKFLDDGWFIKGHQSFVIREDDSEGLHSWVNGYFILEKPSFTLEDPKE